MRPLTKTDLQLYEVKRHIQNGWCKRVLEDKNGNVCILGAVSRVTGVSFLDPGCHSVLTRLEAALAKRGPQSLPHFNDNSTKEEVLDLVQEAIDG